MVRSTDQVAVDDDTLEKEKILFRMKREMANHYAKHDYEKALLAAVEMQDKAEELYGSANPVFASCLSNTALMVCYLSASPFPLLPLLLSLLLPCISSVRGVRSPLSGSKN